MPCRSYEDDWSRSTSVNSAMAAVLETNDKLARIACNVLTAIENGTPLDEVLKDKEISTWWKQHKLADAKAQKEREKKAAEEKAKKAALSKLTPEEKEALGLTKKKRSRGNVSAQY